MANVSLFIGGIRPLPESGRPSGIYKQAVCAPLELGPEGFFGDQQADRRVHGGPEKAVHLYPARHFQQLADRFPDAAAHLKPGGLGENLSTADLDERSVRVGEIWLLGTARLQVCQPRNPCWKIDERHGTEGMAAYIAEHRLCGWYFRVVTPGRVEAGDELLPDGPKLRTMTLAEAMLLCQEHRPPIGDLERLATTPGIANQWKEKIDARLVWLRKNAAPAETFHVKPDTP